MNKKVAELELVILGHLWNLDSKASVHQIIEAWTEKPAPGYTTVLKKLQVMEEKGLVIHEKEGKSYLYIPAVTKSEVSQNRFSRILKNIFMGDKLELAHAFIDSTPLSKEELSEIRKIIEKKENEENEEKEKESES